MKMVNAFLLPSCWGLGLVVALIQSALPLTGQDGNRIGDQEFEKLLQEVDTPRDKSWRQIPWKISLLDAQNEAAKTQKPIFIWAMDGHPLGCT